MFIHQFSGQQGSVDLNTVEEHVQNVFELWIKSKKIKRNEQQQITDVQVVHPTLPQIEENNDELPIIINDKSPEKIVNHHTISACKP